MEIKKHISILLSLILITLLPSSASALSCSVPSDTVAVSLGGVVLYGYDYLVEREPSFMTGDFVRIPLVAGDGWCEAAQSLYVHYLSLLVIILLLALIYVYYRFRRNHVREKLSNQNKNGN